MKKPALTLVVQRIISLKHFAEDIGRAFFTIVFGIKNHGSNRYLNRGCVWSYLRSIF